MGVTRAHAPVLQALNYVDSQLGKAGFDGPVRQRLEQDVEGAVTKLLTDALREMLNVLLCGIDQAATALGDLIALESCMRLLGHLVENYEVALALVVELGGSDVLARALHAHPEHWGVANQAMWALAQMKGPAAAAAVLCDPRLSALNTPVRAAVHALAHLPQCKYPDLEAALRWSDRFQMAQVVVAAMIRHPEDIGMRSYGCSALGSLLVSWAPDVVHSETAKVLPVIFDAMRSDLDNVELQQHATYAICSISQGNAHAAAVLRLEPSAATLAQVLERHCEHGRVRQNLLKTVMAVEGVRGVLAAMVRYTSEAMHTDILWVLGHCDTDDGPDEIIGTDTIACVVGAVQRWGPAVQPNAVGAISKMLLLLLGGAVALTPEGSPCAPVAAAAKQGFEFLIEALHERGGTSAVRTVAYVTLTKAALQNAWARVTLSESTRCRETVLWWRAAQTLHVTETTGALTLACVMQNSVDPVLQAMSEYPSWQELQQAACNALIHVAEADADDPQNSVRQSAVHVARSVCSSLQRQPFAWTSFRIAAARVLGQTLGAISEASGPEASAVLTRGCEDMLAVLQHLTKRAVPTRVSDARCSDIGLVLLSLNTVAEENPTARTILGDPSRGAVKLVAQVTQDLAMRASSVVLTEALHALGLIGSAHLVCEAMGVYLNAYWFQVSGVMALGNLARLGALGAVGEADLACLVASVRRATESFQCRENAALHSQATLTLKLLEIAAS